MDNDLFRVRFWGTRGSLPASGPEFVRYGGNTACVEVRCGPRVLLFDAGSGVRAAGEALLAEGFREFDLFFTHCHYDHIMGLPFFVPLYIPGTKVALWSGHLEGVMTTRQMIGASVRPPWFPVEPDICATVLTCRDFSSGDVLSPSAGIIVRTGDLNHPGRCIGYRVEWGGRVVAMISDTEHVDGKPDEAVLKLIEDADLVIYDCTYTEDEMPRRRGFGHSTWQEGVKLCRAAGAKQLAMFHHDQARTDLALDALERAGREQFPGAFAARDGLTMEIARPVRAQARKRASS